MTESKRALDELVVFRLCSACLLMNGDTKQILYLLKVCSFVWEEAKPGIANRSLQRRETVGQMLCILGEGTRQGRERQGRDSNDLGTALCDRVAKDLSAVEL